MGSRLCSRPSYRWCSRYWWPMALALLYVILNDFFHISLVLYPLTCFKCLDLNLPLSGGAAILVFMFLNLRTPAGSMSEKLSRIDWMFVLCSQIRNPEVTVKLIYLLRPAVEMGLSSAAPRLLFSLSLGEVSPTPGLPRTSSRLSLLVLPVLAPSCFTRYSLLSIQWYPDTFWGTEPAFLGNSYY